jgi:uncharacterized repeat protein (TIGR03803 family)
MLRPASFLITVGILTVISDARAGYVVNPLTSFPTTSNTNGFQPGVVISGNTIYGATARGGSLGGGMAYSLPISGGSLTTLGSFTPQSGGSPEDTPTLVGSTLYGTANGPGTVYSIPIAGGTPTKLTSVNQPLAGLVAVGNVLYGVDAGGNVFSEPITGGAPSTLGSVNGVTLNTLLISGNTIYGVADQGPSNNPDGFVFSLPLAGGTPTILGTFNGANGRNPICTLAISGNTLFGTTQFGGPQNAGVVFSLPVSGGTPAVIGSFNGANGGGPAGALALVGNTLYGTTFGGGPGIPAVSGGVVFSLPVGGGTPAMLAPLDKLTGINPWAGLTAVGNTFYAATRLGGANNSGTVVSVVESPISLSDIAPTSFGSNIGTLTSTNSFQAFTATLAGYSAATFWNSPTQPEVYALDITDSNPANLAADLSALAAQINVQSFSEFSVTATTTDPTGGGLAGNYDLFLTFTNIALNSTTTYFGFDLSQFTANSDTLTASAIAAVPEPAGTSIAIFFGATFVLKRRRVDK